MAAETETAGPTTEDSVGDVLWLLLAVLVLLGMVKVLVVAPPTQPTQPTQPQSGTEVDLSPQKEKRAGVVKLEACSAGLPTGGGGVPAGKLAEGLTAVPCKRLVFVLDGRAKMAQHWQKAVALVRAQLLGSPSAERAEVVILNGDVSLLPPRLERTAQNEPLDPIAIAVWCDQLEAVTPIHAGPLARLADYLEPLGLDEDARVVLLLRDQTEDSKPDPLNLKCLLQIVLFGHLPAAADALGSWALRSVHECGGAVTILP